MPLRTHDDMVAPAPSDPARKVYEMTKARIHDEDEPMPPAGELAAAEMAALDTWIDAGAPPAEDGCEVEPPPPEPIGPEALPCEVTHTFTAHALGSEAPYHVPEVGADNLYQCFTFPSPWNGVTQATAWAPIVGDERVLHHWILYRTATPQPAGGVMNCQMPSDATFVAGWAPGGQNFVMPDDVGLELAGPTDSLILQIHYHNVAHYPDALDASGVAFCTTDTPRTYDAGVFTLGDVTIDIPPYAQDWQESGMCGSFLTSYLEQPVTIIASFPHMHQLGTKFRTDIMRGSNNGPVQNLVDIQHWDFENQQFYRHDPPVVFDPGDAVRTTCTYDNPTTDAVKFGEKTEDEMCFNFVMLYPISMFESQRQCGLF
jgi:hypothetical protein